MAVVVVACVGVADTLQHDGVHQSHGTSGGVGTLAGGSAGKTSSSTSADHL